MKIAALAGSLRAGSFNKKLLAVAAAAARAEGADVDVIELRPLEIPLYDGDLEAELGAPSGVVQLKQRLAAADAWILASPEYNGSIPGVLKNALDWASRPPNPPFSGKIVGLLGASPGYFGAVRGLVHLRQTLTHMDAWVLPRQVTVASANAAFGPDGALVDPKLDAQVTAFVRALLAAAGKLA